MTTETTAITDPPTPSAIPMQHTTQAKQMKPTRGADSPHEHHNHAMRVIRASAPCFRLLVWWKCSRRSPPASTSQESPLRFSIDPSAHRDRVRCDAIHTTPHSTQIMHPHAHTHLDRRHRGHTPCCSLRIDQQQERSLSLSLHMRGACMCDVVCAACCLPLSLAVPTPYINTPTSI